MSITRPLSNTECTSIVRELKTADIISNSEYDQLNMLCAMPTKFAFKLINVFEQRVKLYLENTQTQIVFQHQGVAGLLENITEDGSSEELAISYAYQMLAKQNRFDALFSLLSFFRDATPLIQDSWDWAVPMGFTNIKSYSIEWRDEELAGAKQLMQLSRELFIFVITMWQCYQILGLNLLKRLNMTAENQLISSDLISGFSAQELMNIKISGLLSDIHEEIKSDEDVINKIFSKKENIELYMKSIVLFSKSIQFYLQPMFDKYFSSDISHPKIPERLFRLNYQDQPYDLRDASQRVLLMTTIFTPRFATSIVGYHLKQKAHDRSFSCINMIAGEICAPALKLINVEFNIERKDAKQKLDEYVISAIVKFEHQKISVEKEFKEEEERIANNHKKIQEYNATINAAFREDEQQLAQEIATIKSQLAQRAADINTYKNQIDSGYLLGKNALLSQADQYREKMRNFYNSSGFFVKTNANVVLSSRGTLQLDGYHATVHAKFPMQLR